LPYGLCGIVTWDFLSKDFGLFLSFDEWQYDIQAWGILECERLSNSVIAHRNRSPLSARLPTCVSLAVKSLSTGLTVDLAAESVSDPGILSISNYSVQSSANVSLLPFGTPRVLRAFLIEEQKIVKRVLKLQEAETAAAAASKKKKAAGPGKKKAKK
jgi:hypothetical protein